MKIPSISNLNPMKYLSTLNRVCLHHKHTHARTVVHTDTTGGEKKPGNNIIYSNYIIMAKIIIGKHRMGSDWNIIKFSHHNYVLCENRMYVRIRNQLYNDSANIDGEDDDEDDEEEVANNLFVLPAWPACLLRCSSDGLNA